MENQLRERILKLKKEKNAVILAHYYAPAEAQSIADHVGDSFYLAKIAKKSAAEIILMTGITKRSASNIFSWSAIMKL